MSSTNKINEAMQIAKDGNKAEARGLVLTILATDQSNITALKAMATLSQSKDEAIGYLQQVLQVDSADKWAQGSLSKLITPPTESPTPHAALQDNTGASSIRIHIILGAIVAISGLILPWGRSVSSFSGRAIENAGTDPAGLITTSVGVIVLLIGLSAKPRPGKYVAPLATALAVLSGLIAGLNILTISNFLGGSVGPGPYAVIAGSLIFATGGLRKWPGTV